MTKRKPREFSGLFLFMQKRDTYFSVEKVDERAHEKGCHNCADTNKSRNGGNLAAAKEEQGDAKNHTGKICTDANEFEFADFPFVSHDESNGIIGGYAKVCGNVDRTAEAERHKTENETGNANHHGRIREDRQQGIVGELHHIAQEKQIDECGNADIMSVKNKGKQQKQCIYDDIECAEVDGEHLMGAAHKGLKGVNAKSCQFEKAHTDCPDHDTDHGHKDSFCFHNTYLRKALCCAEGFCYSYSSINRSAMEYSTAEPASVTLSPFILQCRVPPLAEDCLAMISSLPSFFAHRGTIWQ